MTTTDPGESPDVRRPGAAGWPADLDLGAPRRERVLPSMTRSEWAAVVAIGLLGELMGLAFTPTVVLPDSLTLGQTIVLVAIDFLTWLPVNVAHFWWFDRLPLHGATRGRNAVLRAAGGLLAAVPQVFASFLLCSLAAHAMGIGQVIGSDVWYAPGAQVFYMLVAVTLSWVVHHVLQQLHLTRHVIEHNAELRLHATIARLDALRGELEPHFLFNALNGVAELVHRDAERAETMLLRLSSLLRASLEDRSAVTVPLRDELARIDDYLGLQQMRFGPRLQVVRRIAATAEDALVPPMLLQPLVENALVHGIERREAAGVLELRAEREDGRLVITVRDDGPGPDGSGRRGTGVGLRNTRDRLAALYRDGASLTLVPAEGGGTSVTVTLPYATGDAE